MSLLLLLPLLLLLLHSNLALVWCCSFNGGVWTPAQFMPVPLMPAHPMPLGLSTNLVAVFVPRLLLLLLCLNAEIQHDGPC